MSIYNDTSQFGVGDNSGCSQSDSRTVLQIIWSCFVTILSCTWVSMHTNIPHPDATDWQVWRDRLYLTVGALVAPEIIVLWAMRQWIGARLLSKEFEAYGFSRTHAHFFQMGGFMLHKNKQKLGVLSSGWSHLQPLLQGRGLTYGGNIIFSEAIKFQLPTKAEIQEKSKGDPLSKAVVVGQTLWFIIQCVARRVYGLALTELELVTLAFAALNCMVYFLWWDKPLGVRFAVPVVWESPEEDVEGESIVCREIEKNRVACGDVHTSLNSNQKTPLFRWFTRNFSKIKDKFFYQAEEGAMEVSILYAHIAALQINFQVLSAASLLGVLFGAIHCIAWRFTFPTSTERMLWRVCSLVITLSPLFVVVRSLSRCRNPNVPIDRRCDITGFGKMAPDFLFIAIVALSPIYVIARTYLFLGALIALRDVPQDALSQINWVNYIPHV